MESTQGITIHEHLQQIIHINSENFRYFYRKKPTDDDVANDVDQSNPHSYLTNLRI